MTIAMAPADLRQDKKLRKIYNWEENLKNIFYGEGLDVGLREGRIEGTNNRNIEIAKKMLDSYDIQEISRITGLSIPIIEELKKEPTL